MKITGIRIEFFLFLYLTVLHKALSLRIPVTIQQSAIL